MTKLQAQGVALLLLLLALPVLTFGVNNEVRALTIAGVAMVAAGALLLPALRYVQLGPAEEEEE